MNWKIWRIKDNKSMRVRIVESMKSIEIYRKELEGIKRRLEVRREKLFGLTVNAMEAKDKLRAKVYATEHGELKRVIKVVTMSELALTQIVIRLESICDTGDVVAQVSSAFDVVKKVGEEIKTIMPQLENTMQEVNDVLTDTLSSLGQLSPESSIVLDVSQGKEILESAKKYVEEKINTLDEPIPETVQASSGEFALDKIQNIVLLASGEDEEEQPFKATLLKAPRPTPEQANLDDKVLDYIKVKNTYNVIEIATSLGVPVDKIEQSIFRLASSGKIHSGEVE